MVLFKLRLRPAVCLDLVFERGLELLEVDLQNVVVDASLLLNLQLRHLGEGVCKVKERAKPLQEVFLADPQVGVEFGTFLLGGSEDH